MAGQFPHGPLSPQQFFVPPEAPSSFLAVAGEGDGVGGSGDALLEGAALIGTAAGAGGASGAATATQAVTGSSAGAATSTGTLTENAALTGVSAGAGGGAGTVTETGGLVDLAGGSAYAPYRRLRISQPPERERRTKLRLPEPEIVVVVEAKDEAAVLALYAAGAIDLEEFAALIAA